MILVTNHLIYYGKYGFTCFYFSQKYLQWAHKADFFFGTMFPENLSFVFVFRHVNNL